MSGIKESVRIQWLRKRMVILSGKHSRTDLTSSRDNPRNTIHKSGYHTLWYLFDII